MRILAQGLELWKQEKDMLSWDAPHSSSGSYMGS